MRGAGRSANALDAEFCRCPGNCEIGPQIMTQLSIHRHEFRTSAFTIYLLLSRDN